MNSNCSDWDEDLPPEPEKAYSDLLRALKRNSGFGLYFVQCTPVEADHCIKKVPQDMPHKNIEVLRYVEEIDNLYQRVNEFVKDKQIDILLIKGLEYSLYKYEKRSFGEITESKFSNISSVPRILNHLNQQRERFRDDFRFSFVFLLRSFSINYLIHRAPDFFDWRSAVFELTTTPEVVEQESSRLTLEGNFEEYLKLSQEQKLEKVLDVQELLTSKHQTEERKASLQFELGNLLYSAKEHEAAIVSYNQAIKIHTDKYQAWNNRGVALGNLERYEDAISSFDQVVKFKPDYHESWYNRGIVLRNLGRYEDAILSYDQAVKFKPDDHQAWYNRGIALGKLGRYEDEIASYDQAVKFKPDDHQAWNNRGIALGNLERYEDAIASYDVAVKFQPDFHLAWSKRGIALDELGRYEDAIASYDVAVKFQPDDHQAWYNRGFALGNLKRYEEAIASYDVAVKFQPDLHQAWYNKACYYALQGNIEQALENLQQAINLNPEKYREMVKTDSDFDGIREDKRFQYLIQ